MEARRLIKMSETIYNKLKKIGESAPVKVISKISKILVFICFIWTSIVLFRVGSYILASLILLSLGMFMLFNKIDSMERYQQ
jgi:hypothetical protein